MDEELPGNLLDKLGEGLYSSKSLPTVFLLDNEFSFKGEIRHAHILRRLSSCVGKGHVILSVAWL